MTELAPDEKVCPFCAEIIKKAAVKCRYCQSELPAEPAAVPGPADEPPPRPVPLDDPVDPVEEDSVADAPARRSGRASFFSSLRLMVVLLVLCVALGVLAAISYDRSRNPDQGSGAITSTSAREDGLTQAASLTQKVLSYNYSTLDQDIAANEKLLAPSFRREYTKTMAGVHAQTVKDHVKLVATVVASSTVSATPDKIVSLVFVNQTTTAQGTNNSRIDQNRVLVTLTRDAGEWRVSKMDAF
jgi:Mce-associated membrane protein